MRLRPLAVALVLLALPLAGCAGPRASLVMTIEQFSIDPNPAENSTRIGAVAKVRADNADVDVRVMLWAQDAARNVLLAAVPQRVQVRAGETATLNYSERANGLGFPIKFLLHGPEIRAEAWPDIGLLGHPFLSRLDAAPGNWSHEVSFALDRQNVHFVIDNTAVATDPRGDVTGELTILVNRQLRAGPKAVNLAPGAHEDVPLVLRAGEQVQVLWTGGRADLLAYVSDGVYNRYKDEASKPAA